MVGSERVQRISNNMTAMTVLRYRATPIKNSKVRTSLINRIFWRNLQREIKITVNAIKIMQVLCTLTRDCTYNLLTLTNNHNLTDGVEELIKNGRRHLQTGS